MRLFLLSALCSLLSALSATAQTKQVIKGISDNALTESLVVPTGKTLTINSGGSIVNNGTATGFTTGLAIGTSAITGGASGHVLYNNAGTLGGLALNASAVGLGNVSNALQLVAANNLSDLTNTGTARTNLGLGTLATQSATITDYLTTASAATTYAPLASPTFTGTVTIPSGASISGYLTTATAATTYAPLASPTFTGTVTIPSGASISGYLTTATAATTYQPLATLLTSFSNLVNSAGVLTNNGSGTLSYTATSTGGNGVTDGLKLAQFNINGYLVGRRVIAQDATASSSITTNLIYNGVQFNTSLVATTTLSATSGSSTFLLPGISSGTYNLITTGDTGTVTNTMLAGSIDLTTKVTGTLPVANGGTGITALGTGVATALGVNTGTSGAFVVNGGALGTPSSGTLTNCTSLPVSGITASTSAALGVGSIELGHATDTTLARVSAGVASIEGATIATLTAANTFTQTQGMPGITGTGGGGLYLIINGNGTSGSMIGVTGYMPGYTAGSAGGIGFSSGAPSSGYDTFFTRDSAAVMQLGSDGASPTSYQIKSADGTGTNIAASNLTLGGSRSTGTGFGGDVIVITSMTGSSGSSANSTQERSRVIGRFKDLTESTATNFASIALASGKVVGGTATITVWASDGTDHQALTSEISFGAINKAGTVTATVSQTDGTTAASAGTLTVTYDATASGNNVLLRANATSSLTQTILRSRCVITAINGDDTQTVTPQ